MKTKSIILTSEEISHLLLLSHADAIDMIKMTKDSKTSDHIKQGTMKCAILDKTIADKLKQAQIEMNQSTGE